ncbi:MAG: hypothetical protein KatS3mg028_0597 [Bacteroidia bacterium]|nr:MAG: hypothetical protein KatS3mg028_0597 [Bacteroidia bacterium]
MLIIINLQKKYIFEGYLLKHTGINVKPLKPKNMKKVFALIAISGMTAFYACSNAEKQEETTTTEQTTTEQTEQTTAPADSATSAPADSSAAAPAEGQH